MVSAQPGLPPTPGPGPSGGRALAATWTGCSIWGAGIGADFNLSEPSDGAAATRLPYDLTPYKGITFWGMATPGSDAHLRVKVVRRAETRVEDGGTCDEAVVGINRCSDSWGQLFSLPTAGNWQQVVVLFSDASKFKQEGWGLLFPWDPTDVFGIQIQSQGSEVAQPFDFWIDDVYLIR